MSEIAPKQGYYPSAKVKLTIRFEDFAPKYTDPSGKDDKKGKSPKKAARNLKGIVVPRAELKVDKEISTDGTPRFVLRGMVDAENNVVSPDQKPNSTPTAPRDSLPTNTATVLGIIPHQATMRKNNPRIADTLNVTLRYEDFPLNPLTIRATAVEYYLGTVSASDYARGMAGETRKTLTAGSVQSIEPLHMVPDFYVNPEDGQRRSNLRFQGWVDKCELEFNEGVPFVRLECTDNTRLFMDQPAPPNLRIEPKLPIEEAVAQYLSHFPQFEGVTVQYYPESEAGTVMIQGALAKPLHPPHLGPAPAGGGGGEDMSVMDYLVQVVGTLAHLVRIDGSDLVIQKSNSLVGGKRRTRPNDSYVSRTVNNVVYPYRSIIYGWNASMVKFTRQFSGRAPKNIEIRSYNPAKKSPTVGRYPLKGNKIISPMPGGKEDDKWNVQTVAPGLSQEQVDEIAKQTYEAISRTEISVTVKTKNPASYGGGNDNPDMLDLQTGDPINIFVDKSDAASTVAGTDAALSVAYTAERRLISLGFSEHFAKLYAQARAHTAMPKTFYTRDASITWSIESGIDIEVEAVNYIEARLEGEDAQNS